MTLGTTTGVMAAQPLDDLSRFVEPSHMRVAAARKRYGVRKAWMLLDRQEQLCTRFVETLALKK